MVVLVPPFIIGITGHILSQVTRLAVELLPFHGAFGVADVRVDCAHHHLHHRITNHPARIAVAIAMKSPMVEVCLL